MQKGRRFRINILCLKKQQSVPTTHFVGKYYKHLFRINILCRLDRMLILSATSSLTYYWHCRTNATHPFIFLHRSMKWVFGTDCCFLKHRILILKGCPFCMYMWCLPTKWVVGIDCCFLGPPRINKRGHQEGQKQQILLWQSTTHINKYVDQQNGLIVKIVVSGPPSHFLYPRQEQSGAQFLYEIMTSAKIITTTT